MPLDVICDNTQKVPISAAPESATGGVASLDGPLRGRVVSGDGSFEVDASGQAYVVSGSATSETDENGVAIPARTVFEITGDADLGPGKELLPDLVTLLVTAPKAVSLGLSAGAAVPK